MRLSAGRVAAFDKFKGAHPQNVTMLKFAVLASGSKGNATVVTDGHSTVLIDNGLSYSRLWDRLDDVGLSPRQLDAVFVTHEHGDHVKGLKVLANQVQLTVHATAGTCEALPQDLRNRLSLEPFTAGETVTVGSLSVGSFPVPHDTSEPVGYTVTNAGAKLCLAMDFGHVSPQVQTSFSGAHAVVLEANYCPTMLRHGPYPVWLQNRISSRTGHLSNRDTMKLVGDLAGEDPQIIVLAHLSEKNNCPELVSRLARETLGGHPAQVIVAQQDAATPLFEVAA